MSPSSRLRADFPTWEKGRYFEIAALRHTLTVLTRSMIRYTLPPCDDCARDTWRANLAQISGCETLASQHSSPSLRQRNFISPIENVFYRTTHSRGEVGGGFRFLVNPQFVRAPEKSPSRTSPIPTCAGEDSCNFNSPRRRSEKSRILGGTSGSAHPRVSSM